ncbi:ATP-dependent DNA helicase RecG [Phycicoccus sp. Soil803]|uniref:ATP-dependent DNA helicase RecG n=1 Tax=Phycicoccus sp. Soil803 TaxID=1736415 RepID=UPI00070BF904|nr:ATP-dependent DNA helicase RecG [Phycicoccus sp. Soil803]KRF25543.1 ATP-dependent DNA helicase RecG [Phycicoccus sp. Soil803]
MVDERTKLDKLLGVRTAGNLAKHRDLVTVGDLLEFWPRRYLEHTSDLSDLHMGKYVVAVAEVKTAATRRPKSGRGEMLTVTITDGRNDVDLVFFKAWGHKDALVPGVRAVFAGTVGMYGKKWQLAHPAYQLVEGGDLGVAATDRGPIPVYLQVKGLQNWTVAECVRIVFDHLEEVPEPLPANLRRRHGLPERLEALRGIHVPKAFPEVQRARQRLRYEEALVFQTLLAQRRARQAADRTVARTPRAGGLLAAFDARLPFELTDGQKAVGATLAEELARDVPMNRLLQGEVGSGKTIIALRAMLAAIDSGGQAALLAPTEVLAAQHHRSITTMLGDLAEGGLLGGSDIGTRVALLTGSQATAARRENLLQAASGDAGIVIGTHALIQEKVQFQDLALVVVDEQHRFGVEQRDALREKGSQPPHVLVMTATPIPRTVTMTVFGDMETSTLAELPRGRSPIVTHVVPADRGAWVQRTWERVAEEVRSGRQAYVVCPRIGDGDSRAAGSAATADEEEISGVFAPTDEDGDEGEVAAPPREMASVYAVETTLRANPALAGLSIAVLHGRMAPEDKDAVMSAFTAGRIDVLVSTTVIEVGVDVPNATVMVVVDADRFGVSQLHQLRGRVGRGVHPGLCLLMTSSEAEASVERLQAVAATNDGFELARLDLELRGTGDVLSGRQSGGGRSGRAMGRGSFRFLSLVRDEEVILQAREDAAELVAADPELTEHPELAKAVAERVDAEQAAFLDRG